MKSFFGFLKHVVVKAKGLLTVPFLYVKILYLRFKIKKPQKEIAESNILVPNDTSFTVPESGLYQITYSFAMADRSPKKKEKEYQKES